MLLNQAKGHLTLYSTDAIFFIPLSVTFSIKISVAVQLSCLGLRP